MPDKYYTKWIRRFALLAMFNLSIAGFNIWRIYTEIIADKYNQAWFTAFLIFVNLTTAAFMCIRVWNLRKEQKEKVWEILSTPENQIW